MKSFFRRAFTVGALALGLLAMPSIMPMQPASAYVQVPESIAAGDYHTCALRNNGTIRCWGQNNYGELGNTSVPGDNLSAVTVTGIVNATKIVAGGSHTCALLTIGQIKCWGYNGFGELGYAGAGTATPTVVSGITGAIDVAANVGATCALLNTAVVKCWGFGLTGGLGSGSYSNSAVPVPVIGLTGATAIAMGGDHGCAIVALGNVKCWGNGIDGELGSTSNGNNNSATPVTVTGVINATAIGLGRYHSCLVTGGAVKCFGFNNHGQLGDNSINKTPTPVNVVGLTGITELALGGYHSCALDSSSVVHCWGYNIDGALGDGSYNESHVPVTVPGLPAIDHIAAAYYHTCALTNLAAAVKCFGYNNHGQVGDGTKNNAPSPLDVPSLNGIVGPPPVSEFVPLNPGRLVDTRPGAATVDHFSEATGLVAAGSVTQFAATGRYNIPDDAKAEALNVTVTGAQSDGFITVFPCGSTQPNASNINFSTGDTVANVVIAKSGAQGYVCIYSTAATHLLVDVNGYYPVSSPYVPTDPGRIIDTRPGAQTVDHSFEGIGVRAAGSVTQLTVAGRYGVPADASAVALNITVTGSIAGSFLTVFPCGATQPNTSTLNYNAGQTIANAAISKIGTNGQVCFYTDTATHLLVDVNGYTPSTSVYAPLAPGRLLDSRAGATTIDHVSEAIGIRAAGAVTQLTVGGRGGVPANATTAMLNFTVTGSSSGSFVTVYPCGTTQPNSSNLNYNAGQTIANGAITKIGTGSQVCIYTDTATHLIVDVVGYYP